MIDRWVVLAVLVCWVGATLVLSSLRWFRSPALIDRLRPYVAGAPSRDRVGVLSAESVRDVVAPIVSDVGARLGRLFGVSDEVSARLVRTGSPLDVAGFRLKQAAWAGGALFGAAVVSAVVGLVLPVAVVCTIGAPLLVFLVLEQRLLAASQDWQRRVLLELPVVIEQLGMLLSSGYSLGAAIGRVGARGSGACAEQFRVVSSRIRHGVSEVDALREFARLGDLAALDRLVGVLALNWEAGDLGALISSEARAVRRAVQRDQVELIERRAQQVWIPVTVATLLPGVIFMAVPFVDAMRRLTGG